MSRSLKKVCRNFSLLAVLARGLARDWLRVFREMKIKEQNTNTH